MARAWCRHLVISENIGHSPMHNFFLYQTALTFLHTTGAKQRYKNPDNIEKVYIQLRFPDYSQLNKIKRGRK